MTQDEIIEMARQADIPLEDIYSYEVVGLSELEAFAKLVAEAAASKEREACAKEAESVEAWYDDNRGIAKVIRARGEA